MKRVFTLVLGALALITVALVSAFISMRLAIHGREVDVPQLAGLSISDASRLAARDGLALNLENRFYSTAVPAGHIIAQDPAPGARVRREWAVRLTESLGPQVASIPDLTGQSERAATVSIRRLSLDPGAIAHLPVPGDPGVVLTQTPAPNAAGVDGPRVSLLVSDPVPSVQTAYVMPSLVGLSFGSAAARANALGMRVVLAPAAEPASSAPAAPESSAEPGQALSSAQSNLLTLSTPTAPAPVTSRTAGTVTAQSPLPGHRVVKGDTVHITLGHADAAASSASQ
jgi:beta-lactam-binding protein with PASTA domain